MLCVKKLLIFYHECSSAADFLFNISSFLSTLVCAQFFTFLLQLEGLWVSYRVTSASEADLYVTSPKFSVLDIRPDTKPEMRLMLGTCTDVLKQARRGSPFFLDKGGFVRVDSEPAASTGVLNLTMFLMDYRWRLYSQLFVIRIQQPRVLGDPDFLLAVGEFFVPALGTITGREELMILRMILSVNKPA